MAKENRKIKSQQLYSSTKTAKYSRFTVETLHTGYEEYNGQKKKFYHNFDQATVNLEPCLQYGLHGLQFVHMVWQSMHTVSQSIHTV